ncbi:AAA-like domain-containing protein [Lyngbya aestuarii]|uniref:AAA-like domain-containing protein n=1 Tax=Lyngbya aestuarii TaxID=118322 RepID=UPI00403E23D2
MAQLSCSQVIINRQEFNGVLEELTPRKKQVLDRMLSGDTDEEIAKSLNIAEATVRKHIQEICHAFGLKNAPGEHYSLRDHLIELFEKYKSQPNPQYLESSFYVERVPHQQNCYKALLQPGALIRIKAPQQMGKQLMIERVVAQVRTQGYSTLTLSFELADNTVFTDLRQFSRWLCARVGQDLGLANQLDEYWDDIFGCNSNTTDYFQKYLLAQIESPFVLVLQKVDRVFEHPEIADDFCRLLRGWYDLARRGDHTSVIWQKLRLVIVHSTEIYSSLDINHSPLAGVGLEVELPEFSPEEVQDLVKRHGLNWTLTEVKQLMAMIGGHPYLVRKALAYLKHQSVKLEPFLQLAPTEAGPFSDHLRRHLWNLQQSPLLVSALAEVVTSSSWVSLPSEAAFKLYSMGLLSLQGNSVMPRCDLYRRYFSDRLNKKDSE